MTNVYEQYQLVSTVPLLNYGCTYMIYSHSYIRRFWIQVQFLWLRWVRLRICFSLVFCSRSKQRLTIGLSNVKVHIFRPRDIQKHFSQRRNRHAVSFMRAICEFCSFHVLGGWVGGGKIRKSFPHPAPTTSDLSRPVSALARDIGICLHTWRRWPSLLWPVFPHCNISVPRQVSDPLHNGILSSLSVSDVFFQIGWVYPYEQYNENQFQIFHILLFNSFVLFFVFSVECYSRIFLYLWDITRWPILLWSHSLVNTLTTSYCIALDPQIVSLEFRYNGVCKVMLWNSFVLYGDLLLCNLLVLGKRKWSNKSFSHNKNNFMTWKHLAG